MHDELRRRVLAENLAIVDAGLVTLTFGNVSGIDRAAGVMAIKPSGVPYELLDERAIVIVDLGSGEPVNGSLRPSSDAPTHRVLYQCFGDVGGVVHTHSPFATAWRRRGGRFPASARRTPITSAVPFPLPVRSTRTRLTSTMRRNRERDRGSSLRSRGHARRPGPRPRAVHVGGGSGARSGERHRLEAVAALAFRTQAIEPHPEELDERLRDRHFARKHGESRYYGQS